MKHLACLVLSLLALPVFAATPLQLPSPLPPLRIPQAAHPQPRPPAGVPVLVWTPQLINSLNLSSTVTRDLLAHLVSSVPVVGSANHSATATQTTPIVRDGISPASTTGLHRRAIPMATALGTSPAVSDSSQDIEPSIITNRFGGVDRTTTVFTKFVSGDIPFHYWTSTTDYVNYAGWPSGYQLPLPPNTTRSSDPLLSENPYAYSGAFPGRTYCVGISYDVAQLPTVHPTHSALTVWYTDNPGAGQNAWNTTVVEQDDNPIFYDKPSIATSWNWNTLGYTYVATLIIHLDTGYHDIQVYRQGATTGFTLVNRQFLYMPVGVTSPILTVDSATGDVYLLWLDTTNNVIQIARSTDMGNTFGAPVTVGAESLVSANNGSICDWQHLNCVRAASVIMARTNDADHSVGVVWHLREIDGTHTDAGFNQFRFASQSWRWWRGIQIGHPGANDQRDQWNPALDPSSDGSYMLTWYDKRDDPNNNLYRVYSTRVNADGTAIDPTDTLIYNAAAGADLSQLPQIPPPPQAGIRYMGEYQDIWEWYGTWYGSTTYIAPNGNQDIYITRTAP